MKPSLFCLGVVLLACHVAAAAPVEWKEIPADGVIVEPGSYYLAKDVLTDRNPGIRVEADRVTLDFRGNALRYTGTPKSGVNGIVISGHTGVTIQNGALGGFWFGMHCTDAPRLRIHDMRFDDIVYIAVNVARSRDVAITDNSFTNFRYDIPKDAKSTYVIGVNLTADDVLVARNRFDARPPAGTGADLAMETVCVLFRPSKRCIVSHNQMLGSEPLNRSYAVWVAEKVTATVVYNEIHNMQHGVTVAPEGMATVIDNDFKIDSPPAGSKTLDSIAISAPNPAALTETRNKFSGYAQNVLVPQK